MFLRTVEERNQALIDYAITLHETGEILPDTYVIDVDSLVENTKKMSKAAAENNVELYYMTKQIGRNPYLSRKIHEAGIEKAVVVDFKEALVLMEEGLPIGNVGHLVQIPRALLEKILAYGADYVTVYSTEMIAQINEVAQKLGIKQKVMMRIINTDDVLYDGQYGGFLYNELDGIIETLAGFEHVEIAAVTSFPCFLYDADAGDFKALSNAHTIMYAQEKLKAHGFPVETVNMPSATSIRSIPFIADIKGTQGEPGHALTGTTPMHAKMHLEEKPAMVYVSEVSHTFKGKSYIYGGGYYRRGHLTNALVVTSDGTKSYDTINELSPESIDYYLEMNAEHPVGETVVMSARTQIFVTRSHVALVEGLSSGQPHLVGMYDSQGREL